MKKNIIILMMILSTSIIFAFNFGWGGSQIQFIPESSLQQLIPLNDLKINGGMVLYGGSGAGRIANGIYIGGQGESGSLRTGEYEISINQGFFMFGTHLNPFKILSFEVGLGFGGSEIAIKKFVDGDANTIDDFVNSPQKVPYIVSLNTDMFALNTQAKIYLNLAEFFSIIVHGNFIYGFSSDGWKIENTYNLKDTLPTNYYYYTIGAGVMWGF
ncbi:hypothetical protein XO10_08135 [Marinitoga sp. 1135]|uniref:Outer membrane protein beta-barrel domain-containing protein n=1 Tax=Marinitoga piezophila (strain DSM 14283 / JCM 11233 / KA3) TaxID=443254 RepID=H2J523_MARPK|nr:MULTISPECIES: hypothetical protein [Marinitoga]AEX86040.1 hypothetical protein Marpi_1651 [Marinitoga piezophila KA3]APT76463.1 hypothetical protein LN42_08795 [Marinitoga sp. 1137]NUU96224.1 hypothetical protein [Marinitoga sp. 1135]NUU98147.1 hypothetical protein [Marinitoga sp. 1138]